MGLAAALHDGTKALHTDAERSGVMGALLRGAATRDAYLRLLASLHAIYEGLEQALERHAAHPALAAMHEPAFARLASLERDLHASLGDGWRTQGLAAPTAVAYAEHLERIARDDATLLLAHAWLRYLGDLNGGQILARLVRGTPALATVSTTFYEFPGLADPRAAAQAWRARLDTLALAPATEAALVAEARDGFVRHIAIFRELADQEPPGSSPSAA